MLTGGKGNAGQDEGAVLSENVRFCPRCHYSVLVG